MEKRFTELLRDPQTGNRLKLTIFKAEDENIIEGLLIDESSTNLYCIFGGVPVMLTSGLPADFYKSHQPEIENLKKEHATLQLKINNDPVDWSFSHEWDYFESEQMDKTWHMTVQDRFKKFLFENQVTEEAMQDKLILDAGCGNGTHTENLANHGGTLVGIDYSESIFKAEKRRKAKNLLFVRGDLQNPPFAEETFDIIFSNGVIHHTPSTYKTFVSVAKLPKKNGSLYLWLYNRQGGLGWRFKRRFFDVSRMIVSRFPGGAQKKAVSVYTFALFNIRKMLGFKDEYKDMSLDMYDSITPRWRHYHEPIEVWKWYNDNGYPEVMITSWETLYGYGILGKRR